MKKELYRKKLIIECIEQEDGSVSVIRRNAGFNKIELAGILQIALNEILHEALTPKETVSSDNRALCKSIKLRDLGLSVRIQNIMKWFNVETIWDMYKILSKKKLLLRRGAGKTTVKAVEDLLEVYGLELKEE